MLLRSLPKFLRDKIPKKYFPEIQKAIIFLIILFFFFVYFYPTDPVEQKNFGENSKTVEKSELDYCLDEWGRLHEDVEDDKNQDADGCPKEPPAELRDAFTMNGKIDVHMWYKCQTGPAYHKKHHYTQEQVDDSEQKVQYRMSQYYGITDIHLYDSIDAYPFEGKDVVVMGSQRPTYETVCLVYGASSCTTIDFQPITSDDPRLQFLTIAEYDENPKQFDAAISISSFEHDGLGRYGDPMRPHGDLDMMKKMKCIVKPGGYLYLSVPLAKDKIVWNMHRVYGRVRLPELLKHWKLEGFYGREYEMKRRYTGCDADGEGDFQPILVLKNEIPEPGHNEEFLSQFIDPKLDGKDFSCFN